MPEPAPLLGGHKSVGPYAGLVFAALYIVVGVAIPFPAPGHCGRGDSLSEIGVLGAVLAGAFDYWSTSRRRQGRATPRRVAFWSSAIGLMALAAVGVLRYAWSKCG